MTGYYLMHRGWMDSQLFRGQRKEAFDQRSAWVWLIEHAQYEPATVLIGGKPVELQRGQLSYSYRYMARAWGWHETKVRRYCVVAALLKMIRCVTDAGQTIITICNYDKYQDLRSVDDADMYASTTQQQRSNNANTKEGKEGNTEEGALVPTTSPSRNLITRHSAPNGAGASAPVERDPAKEIWARGKAVLGKSAGSLIGQALKRYKQLITMQAIIATEKANTPDPIAYFHASLEGIVNGRNAHVAETAAFDFITRTPDDCEPYRSASDALLDAPGTINGSQSGNGRGLGE